MNFHIGQRIRVNGHLATVLETGVADAYGSNSIIYQLDGSVSVTRDNPALSSYYGNNTFEPVNGDDHE